MLRGGVIGFGNVGQSLTRYINGDPSGRARIVAACNRGPANLEVARAQFGLKATSRLDELLDLKPDFVVVASTSAGHADQVAAAVERGIAVFCEKPIALTLRDADQMIGAAERAGVVTVVNYSMRFIDAYLRIRELARGGALGDVLVVRHSKTRGYGLHAAGARHRAVEEPEESGGWTVHHACHDIDFLYWVHGPMRRVYARTVSTVPGGASEEAVLGIVDFADGAIGEIGDSVCAVRDHYTQLIGKRASLVMTGEAGATVLRLRREGAAADELVPARDEKRPGGGLDHFLDCVLAGRQSPNDLASARHSLAVALAMRESARTAQPVDLPPERGAATGGNGRKRGRERGGDMSASGAANGQSTVGLLLADMHTGASVSVWRGVAEEAARRGVNLVCFPGGRLAAVGAPEAAANAVYDLAGPGCLDGLVTWASSLGGRLPAADVASFHERYRGLPLVCLSQAVLGAPTISLDAYRGMRLVVEHLVTTHGYRRIAFARGPATHPSAEDRYRAYRDALAAAGIPFDERLVTPPLAWDAGSEAAHILLDVRGLRPGADFQAAVAASDLLALWLLRGLQSRDCQVPGDLAVAGFNDTAESRLASPPLTTAVMPFREQGRRALEMMATLLDGGPAPGSITLPTELVVRQSCGCPSLAVTLAVAAPAGVATGPGASESGVDRRAAAQALSAAGPEAVDEMARAAGLGSDTAAAWLAPLLEAFTADLAGSSDAGFARGSGPVGGRFLTTLDRALERAIRSGVEVSPWQNAVSVLRRRVLAGMALDERPAVEELLAPARILVSEATAKEQTWRQWHADRLAERVRDIGTALLTALDTERIFEVLAASLPGLGIPGAWVVLRDRAGCDGPGAEARLAFALVDGERSRLSAVGEPFPVSQLVPHALLPRSRRWDLVVEPLHARGRTLGYAVFEIGPGDGGVYESLRGHLSSALQAAALMREARDARAAAEKADLVKSRLLANVSHELRTPLAAILRRSRNAAERAAGKGAAAVAAAADTLQDDLAVIGGNAEHQLRVIDDLLDLSRAEIDELDLAFEMVDPRSVLAEAFASVAGPAEAPGPADAPEAPDVPGGPVAWRLELPERLPVVRVDPVRLRQIVLNLLANARTHTAAGSVTLAAEARPPFLEVRVEDTGPGIPADLRERIFEPFFSAERGERPGGGIGLGLSISRHLAALHLGSLAVDSEVGRGSVFRLRLPLPDLSGRVVGPDGDAEPVLLVVGGEGEVPPEVAELCRRRGLAIRRLAVDAAPPDLGGLRPAALAWDLASAGPDDWLMVRRLRRHPLLSQAPVLLFGAGPVGLTGILPKTAAPDTLAGLIEAACPPRAEGPVLVVDDDAESRAALERVVRESSPGLRVRTAADGLAALRAMEEERPSLVLLDVVLPGLDGLSVLDRMRATGPTRDVPVIVLTNRVLSADDVKRIEGHARVLLQAKGVWSDGETAAAVNRSIFGADELPAPTGALVKRAVAWLAANHARPIARWQLAEAVGASEDYLSRIFRRELGLSPWEYLNRYRVHRAGELLKTSGEGVKAIAARVGFQDPAYFSRVFRKFTGAPPRGSRSGPS